MAQNSPITLSATEWMDQQFDTDTIDSMPLPWTNMTKGEVAIIQQRYQEEKIDSGTSTIDILLRTIFCSAGLVGHIFVLVVMRDKEFQNVSGLFLRCISIVDIVFCVSMWLMAILEFRSINSTSWFLMNFYTHFVKNVRGAASYFSDLATIALSGDRIAAVWFFYSYHNIKLKNKIRVIKIFLCFVFLLSLVLQAGWSLSITVASQTNYRGEVSYVFAPRLFYVDGRGQIWEIVTTLYYEYFINSLNLLGGLLILIGMYLLSKRQFTAQNDKNQKKKEFRTCFLSFILSILLIFWAVLDNIKKYVYDNYTFATAELEYSQTFAQAAGVLNSLYIQNLITDSVSWVWTLVHGANFYLYLIFHRRFRRVFRGRLCNNSVNPISAGPGILTRAAMSNAFTNNAFSTIRS